MRNEIENKRVGSKLGGICAILIGLLNVLIIVYVVVTPADQRYDAGAFYLYYAESPLALSAAWIMFAVMSVLAFAVVPAVSDVVRSESEEWVRAASILGIVGFAVLGVNFLTLLGRAGELTQTYVAGDAATRAALAAFGLPEIDPNGWLMFGGVGIWYLVVSVLGWRSRRIPRLLALLGMLMAVGYWMTVIADVFTLEFLNLAAAGLGAVISPIWYVWTGRRLLRAP